MKNIHILPTDKPSRLFEIDGHLIINREQLIQPKYYRNIYITSDEEIKKGDWCLDTLNIILFVSDGRLNVHQNTDKKIILTTDQDLIKDGVQAIDDDFLEWFVKNPSCEFVEIRYNVGTYNPDYLKFYEVAPPKSYYKIIIPKEELIPPTKTTEDIKSIVEDVKEPTLTITLNKDEVRGLLNCIMRTSAKGKDLDVGEMVEDKLVEFLNS